jgi:hypothetical protein
MNAIETQGYKQDLLKWLATPETLNILKKELPQNRTHIANMTGSMVRRLSYMTACGFSNDNLRHLFSILQEQGIVKMEDDYVQVVK